MLLILIMFIIFLTFYLGNYDVMTPMVDILMKLFRNMVNVKMPFHLTLLSVCFCNLKAVNTAKRGLIDYYLTPSLSTTSCSGKHSFVSILFFVQFSKYTLMGFVWLNYKSKCLSF